MADRDAIINNAQSPSTSGVKDASRDRVKSISGGGPAFSNERDRKLGWPVMKSPYSK